MKQPFHGLCLVLWFFTKTLEASTPIILFSAYDYEPFVISETQKTGLMFDLQRALNGKGPYVFEVRIVPRSRLLKLLDRGEACVVPWVAPEWFDDPKRQVYQWTLPLIEDENVIVSAIDKPIKTFDLKEVQGKTTITFLGHKDARLNALIQHGDVRAIQQGSNRNSFQMVARHRIDFLLSGRMIVNYFVKTLALNEQVHVSAIATSHFERRILICRKQDESLRVWLDEQVTQLAKDKAWQENLHGK